MSKSKVIKMPTDSDILRVQCALIETQELFPRHRKSPKLLHLVGILFSVILLIVIYIN